MYCNNCAGDTDVGHVIHPKDHADRKIAPSSQIITNQNMRVIYCEKCKQCGHSEYMYENDVHDGGTKVRLTKSDK